MEYHKVFLSIVISSITWFNYISPPLIIIIIIIVVIIIIIIIIIIINLIISNNDVHSWAGSGYDDNNDHGCVCIHMRSKASEKISRLTGFIQDFSLIGRGTRNFGIYMDKNRRVTVYTALQAVNQLE